ncbi:MAG: hypothetical protein RBU30_26365 [Polyangia bacterium]|jgi:hypothetical protein|nr:hypothetical protein [Polyangia bacterium]
MSMTIPTVDQIIGDVRGRWRLIERLQQLGEESEFTEDDWNGLIYYAQRNQKERMAFLDAFNRIRAGEAPGNAADSLPPHGRWLCAVYTGQELTAGWCKGGSRFHKRVMERYGSDVPPHRVLREIKGLNAALKSLQEELPEANPVVLCNIAIDETFEQLGRFMTPLR